MSKMDALIRLKRRARRPAGPAQKKRRTANGRAQPTDAGYEYATVAGEARQHYEDLRDWDAKMPLMTKRKNCRPMLCNSYRLRMVERFALECGGGGLSLIDQEKLFNLLDVWDRTMPGMPVDAGHYLGIRDAVHSINGFKDALKDDIEDAFESEGWLKANLEVDGESYQAIFRPALTVGLERMRSATEIKLWSGGDRPSQPNDLREHPMDGDAFRQCESEVIKENNESSFVLAFHAFSDASQLSSSGGVFWCDGVGRRVGVERAAPLSAQAVAPCGSGF